MFFRNRNELTRSLSERKKMTLSLAAGSRILLRRLEVERCAECKDVTGEWRISLITRKKRHFIHRLDACVLPLSYLSPKLKDNDVKRCTATPEDAESSDWLSSLRMLGKEGCISCTTSPISNFSLEQPALLKRIVLPPLFRFFNIFLLDG